MPPGLVLYMFYNVQKNRVVKNAAWIIGCKVVQSILALIITMLSARYLGPSNYGLINYAASIVTFMVPVVQLGFRSTLVQECIESPENEGQVFGTAITLNVITSIACIVGIFIFVSIVNRGEKEAIVVCVLYSVSLIFQATEMMQYWYQAKLLSKYTSLTMLISYLIVSAYKIFLLVTKKNVYWFVLAYSIDYSIISFVLFVIYYKIGGMRLSFSWKLGKKMFQKSRYYIISGLMVTVFQQTDRIMLKLMIDNETTAYYSVAVSCAGLAGFVYQAIIDSMRPIILDSKNKNEDQFNINMSRLYSVIIYMGLFQSVVCTILAKPIVLILYGEAYSPSILILQIITWYLAFSYMGSVRNIWILAEDKQKHLWKINLSGAVLNVLGNFILIPIFEASGAAIASVFTQFLTNFVLCIIIKPIIPTAMIILKAMNPKLILEMIPRKEK